MNYFINSSTVALLKDGKKTIIYDVEKSVVINKSIRSIIEFNCNYYGHSVNGTKKAIKKLLNIKYRVPIVVSISNNYTLIPVGNIRNDMCLFLVTSKIIDYEKCNDYLEINCVNNNKFKVNFSINSFEKLLINSIRINNLLINRKNNNYV